jgi:hypothetical protein
MPEWVKVLAGSLTLMIGASALVNQTESQDSVGDKTRAESQWYASPDWWTAGFTGALFIATTGLWIFTALLWRTTRQAVIDGEQAIKAAAETAKAR